MSSQSTCSVPFTFTGPQESLRLIELPPDVLQLLRSSDPPTLKLKSSTLVPRTPINKSTRNAAQEQTTTAHLVTPNKSYLIRQVNTSNSVFLTRPATTLESPEDEAALERTATSLTAFSQVDSVLELQPVQYDAGEELRKVLPVWTSLDVDPSQEEGSRTKRQLFSEIPLPDGHLEQAYVNLLGFSIPPTHTIVRPSATIVLKAWQDISTTAVEQSVDLSSFFFPSALLSHSATSDVGQCLKSSLLRFLTQVTTSDSEHKPSKWNPDEKLWIQKSTLLRWTGTTLFNAKREQVDETDGSSVTEISTEDFLSQWKDLLPETWRDDTDISLLSDKGVSADGGMIRLVQTNSSALTGTGAISQNETTKKETATNDKKRKWHEKFKAERDARTAAGKR